MWREAASDQGAYATGMEETGKIACGVKKPQACSVGATGLRLAAMS
jgi:hypothetical protein